MTKYIFHGGGTRKNTDNNDSFYEVLMKEVPQNGIILLVYFASRTDDNSDKIAYDTQKCIEFSQQKGPVVHVATINNFLKEADEADVIYIRGGSTEKLINVLRQFPDLKLVFENKNKIVAGSSAGAYALSTLYSSHYEDVIGEGLGIVPVRVVTHYQSNTMPPKEGSVTLLRNTSADLELIILKEGEWCTVTL